MNRKHLDNTRLLLPPNTDATFSRYLNEQKHKKRLSDHVSQNRISLFYDRDVARMILPDERVSKCGKIPVSMPGARIAVAGEKGKGKYFSGIMNCGSVWHCPVCARKIGMHRAATVTNFLKEFQKDKKYSLGFLTLTVRHNADEDLKTVLKKLTTSFREIEQSRSFRAGKKNANYFGCIRALEVKRGDNGWHPHLHLLLVAECSDEKLKEFGEFFIDEWLKKNSDSISDAQKYLPVKCEKGIADYITKWNAAAEMTLGSTDKLTGKSFTPFQFLKIYSRHRIHKKTWPEKYAIAELFMNLYQEYSAVMKGKKQLTISRDLIKEFERITNTKFSMKSDEEINIEKQNDSVLVEIDREIFKLISSYNYQAEVLNFCEFQSVEKCVEFLNDNWIECEYDPVRKIIQAITVDEPFEISGGGRDAWKFIPELRGTKIFM